MARMNTKQRRYDNGATAFSDWLRSQEVRDLGLGSNFAGVTDIDFVWFAYKQEESWIMTLEEKCHGKPPDFSQSDTINVFTQLLMLGSERERKIQTARGRRVIEYTGHYTLSFEHTYPNDSSWIKINGEKKTKHDLIQLLRYGRLYPLEVKPELPMEKRVVEIISQWSLHRLSAFTRELIHHAPEHVYSLVIEDIKHYDRKVHRRRKKHESDEQPVLFTLN